MVVLNIIFGLYVNFTPGLGLFDIVINHCSGALQAFDLELQYAERKLVLGQSIYAARIYTFSVQLSRFFEPMGGNFKGHPSQQKQESLSTL